jgi:hypothetical protein
VSHPPCEPVAAQLTRSIVIRSVLFQWETFDQWANRAARDFRGVRAHQTILDKDYVCVDTAGNVCTIGRHFMAARDAGRFPVVCYRVAE